MDVSFLGLCRGNGKILIKAQIEKASPNNTLQVMSQSKDGGELPCRLNSLKDINDSDVSYLISLPILDISQTLIIKEIDAQENTAACFKRRISPFLAKLESGFNYRLRQELAREINVCENYFFHYQISMCFQTCIPDENDTVLRAIIVTPATINIENLAISCIDSQGAGVSVNPVFLSIERYRLPEEKQILSEGSSQEIYQALVSIRIPKELQHYCFIITDSGTPKNKGFGVLDKSLYAELLEKRATTMSNAQDDPEYDDWFSEHRIKQASLDIQRNTLLPKQPLFSLIVPLYKTPFDVFCEMVDSVKDQSYQNWELILVQASPENSKVQDRAQIYVSADKRIKLIDLSENKGISGNTNVGIEAASGDFICFFDHDDLIEPDLLFEYAAAINEKSDIDLLYCDEDKINDRGYHFDPYFKSDFNLDLLRNNNYICHLLCIRKSLIMEIGLLDSKFDGAQDHDLTLRAIEKARAVHHVSKILYHWRASENSTAGNVASKAYATIAGIKAVQSHLDRLGLDAKVEQSRGPFQYKVTYSIPQEQPFVSIIIPNKDSKEMLKTCIDSIVAKSTYTNYEIVIVENNSTSKDVFKYYQGIEGFPNIRVITYEGEFNFSKIINFGVKNSNAEYLLLLNNDTEVITPRWIERMLGICARDDVGAVGVKLYYPDDTIQHAGLVVVPPVVLRPHHHLPKTDPGYFSLNDAEQDMSAVTAACVMTKKSAFEQVNGFAEELAIAFNDIDYCLKLQELGLLVVYTPEVELYHYESISRGGEASKEKKLRFGNEIVYMRKAWAKYYLEGDPYYNRNLSRENVEGKSFCLNWKKAQS